MRGIGVPFLTGNRGDIDDLPTFPCHHGWNQRFADMKDRDQIQLDDLAPFITGTLPQRFTHPGDPGVVDHDVQRDARELGL